MRDITRFLFVVALALGMMNVSAVEKVDSTRVYELEEVVTTGTNRTMSRNLLPYTVTVVRSGELEASGQTQLLSVVSTQVPSLFVSERNIFGFGISNGGSGNIKIRGVGGSPTNAILMMVDGQPQFAGIYSHHVADFYETETVDHVEVLRGPASVLYGSNAMGGVINVITKEAHSEGMKTTIKSEYGSYNTWLTSASNMMRYGRFSSLVSAGYDRTDGVTKGFDFEQWSGYAKVGYDFSDVWKAKIDYSLMRFVGNDPIYPKLSNPASEDVYHQNVTRGETSLTVSNDYGKTSGCVRLYYSYGNHFVEDPKHFHSLDDRLGVLAYQNFGLWTGAAGTIGFDFDRYTGKIPVSGGVEHTEGSIKTMDRKEIIEYSPYATLSQRLIDGLLVLNGGLRMANSDMFGTQWIPQGGFVVTPAAGWEIKGSVAKGYRNPSFKELYLYKMANADLKPEKMINYELTVGKKFSRYIAIDVTGYYSDGSDMIEVEQMKNVNTGKFTNKGIEVSASSHPLDNLSVKASYSYLHTSLDNLTAAPKNQYFVGLAWQATDKLKLAAELRGVGGLYVDKDVENQDYALLNMKVDYQLLRQLGLFVKLDNMTNAQYVINKGYEMPGFTAMGGFKVQF